MSSWSVALQELDLAAPVASLKFSTALAEGSVAPLPLQFRRRTGVPVTTRFPVLVQEPGQSARSACPCCGHVIRFENLPCQFRAEASPALDTRVAGVAGVTVLFDIAQCPHCLWCGFPAGAGASAERLVNVVRSRQYRAVFDAEAPWQARVWLARTMLDLPGGDLVEAFWSTMKATWTCRDMAFAGVCRRAALELMKRCHAAKLQVHDQREQEAAIAIDLLRRVGMYDAALALATKWASHCRKAGHADLAAVLAFQVHLCKLRVDGEYTVEQAVEFALRNPSVVAPASAR